MRIRSTGDQEKDFKCRKIHPVKDSPDPTQHSYVEIKVNQDKATLDILKENDMYSNGKFSHQYFCLKRHIAPCNFNLKCNMSLVISDVFIALKSMQNAQALDLNDFNDKEFALLADLIETQLEFLDKRKKLKDVYENENNCQQNDNQHNGMEYQ